jgi:hypothetical protein
MPKNGDINERFGVYKSLCCSREILLREGVKFPDCPNHPKLTTVWKPVKMDVAQFVPNRKKSRSA